MNACKCGAVPELTEREQYGIQIMRLVCVCGNKSATLMYTKPSDRLRMVQAVWDGWRLSDQMQSDSRSVTSS